MLGTPSRDPRHPAGRRRARRRRDRRRVRPRNRVRAVHVKMLGPVADRSRRATAWKGTWSRWDSRPERENSRPRRQPVRRPRNQATLADARGTRHATTHRPPIARCNRPSTAAISHRRPTRADTAPAAGRSRSAKPSEPLRDHRLLGTLDLNQFRVTQAGDRLDQTRRGR